MKILMRVFAKTKRWPSDMYKLQPTDWLAIVFLLISPTRFGARIREPQMWNQMRNRTAENPPFWPPPPERCLPRHSNVFLINGAQQTTTGRQSPKQVSAFVVRVLNTSSNTCFDVPHPRLIHRRLSKQMDKREPFNRTKSRFSPGEPTPDESETILMTSHASLRKASTVLSAAV